MRNVPLTPDLDLFNNLLILKAELIKITKFFAKHKIEWYIQSSFVVRLRGVSNRKVTDIDIRVKYPLMKLLALLKKEYSAQAKIRDHVKFCNGEFRDECIIIPFWKTHIDITSDIITYNKFDDVEYNIPFDEKYEWIKFHGLTIPICSLAYLIIYKLINKRDKTERKNDAVEAGQLLKYLNQKPMEGGNECENDRFL